MEKYVTWLVIQNPESDLTAILAKRMGNQDLKMDSRPKMSLRWRDDQGVCSLVKSDEHLLGYGHGRHIPCLSSAPEEELRSLNGKLFEDGAGRYRIHWGHRNDSRADPYSRRLLTIEVLAGVPSQGETMYKVVDEEPESADLWLEPQRVELTKEGHLAEFGPNGALGRLTSSFFLPPVRSDDLPPDDAPVESYFDSRLTSIRDSVLELAGVPKAPDQFALNSWIRVVPAGITAVWLCNQPLLRDILRDGGAIQLYESKKSATNFRIHLPSEAGPAAEYRRKVVLEPEELGKAVPDWAKDLCRAIREDICNLLPGGGLSIQDSGFSNQWDRSSWNVVRETRPQVNGDTRAGHYDLIEGIYKKIGDSKLRRLYFEGILEPAAPTNDLRFPDHGRAERLFIQYAWRCPWPYARSEIRNGWLDGLRDILPRELAGETVSPESRIANWNERERGNDTEAFNRFKHDWADDETEPDKQVIVLQCSGQYDKHEALRWRLALPWHSIIRARTLVLNVVGRSKLDGTFVLA